MYAYERVNCINGILTCNTTECLRMRNHFRGAMKSRAVVKEAAEHWGKTTT
jgi:hypothetical protein